MEETVVKDDTLKDGKNVKEPSDGVISAERANPREEALKRIRKMAKERAERFIKNRGTNI